VTKHFLIERAMMGIDGILAVNDTTRSKSTSSVLMDRTSLRANTLLPCFFDLQQVRSLFFL
jgi:hypothetical protein